MRNVLVIDAGLGNIGSVVNAVEREGANVLVKRRSRDMEKESCSQIILPGVGTYVQGMKSLYERGWVEWLKERSNNDRVPILGICLGMQLMSDNGAEGKESEENTKGLGLISGKVEKIKNSNLRLPHIGWNNVHWKTTSKEIVKPDQLETDYYFVHSYHFAATDEMDVIGTVEYGETLVAAVRNENVIGVQFHPEKSQKAGAKLIRNFLYLGEGC
jgi:glutamine amidotransferase